MGEKVKGWINNEGQKYEWKAKYGWNGKTMSEKQEYGWKSIHILWEKHRKNCECCPVSQLIVR